jgi:uracil-DNA glycosylase
MKIEKSWYEVLKEELALPYIGDLKLFLEKERESGQEIYPTDDLIFSAFAKTPFHKAGVVIMGQDPYHGPGQADGLAFSVPFGIPIPPSLQNIFKELQAEYGLRPPNHGCLIHWAEQGVLLLNAVLTVRRGVPQSHAGKGWERFTDAVLRTLARREDPIIFVLWGRAAQTKYHNVLHTSSHHLVLMAAHPSPYSASRFFGCGHFIAINEALGRCGKQPIVWELPPKS